MQIAKPALPLLETKLVRKNEENDQNFFELISQNSSEIKFKKLVSFEIEINV